MTDLDPDVRDRAARAAQSTWLRRPSGAWLAVVDAVAPEIERPLRARIAELREHARRDSHDYELLRQENEQLREALGMARKEYGGKNIADLDEYDRLRLAANGFQAMNGVLELQVKRQRATAAPTQEAILRSAADQLSINAGDARVHNRNVGDGIAYAVHRLREMADGLKSGPRAVTFAELHDEIARRDQQIGALTTALTELHDVVADPDRVMYHDEVAKAAAALSATPTIQKED